MTVVVDRGPVASGTWNQPEPPPELPNVDDAQQFYLYGVGAVTSSSGWLQYMAPQRISYVRPEAQRMANLLNGIAGDLRRLLSIPPGWDGGHANRLTQEAIYAATWILSSV